MVVNRCSFCVFVEALKYIFTPEELKWLDSYPDEARSIQLGIFTPVSKISTNKTSQVCLKKQVQYFLSKMGHVE